MNRRGFLGALLVSSVLDPERLLWVPGKKLISIPALPKVCAFVITARGWSELPPNVTVDELVAGPGTVWRRIAMKG